MAANLDAILRVRAQVDGTNNIVALNRGLQQVENTTRGVTAAMRGVTGAAAGLSGALGALAPLTSVVGLVGLVKSSLDAGDALYDMSQRTGVSVESLAKFRKAAATSGTDIDTVAKSMAKLNRNIVNAAAGQKEATKGFEFLGLSAKNADGSLKSADQVMLEVADRFKSMPDGAAKTAAAMLLFGKSGAEIIPLLNQGSGAIENLSSKLTTAFAKKADEYNDKLATLGGKIGGLAAELTIALLPALDAITTAVTAAVDGFNQLPGPVKALAVGAAALAIAWGPLSGVVAGATQAFLVGKAAIEGIRLQMALAAMEGIPALNAAILSIPGWGWALAGVAALTALGVALYTNNQDFRNWVNNIATIVASDFGNAMKSMAEVARGAAQGVSNIWSWLSRRTGAMFQSMSASIIGWWNSLPAPLRGALSGGGKAVAIGTANMTGNPLVAYGLSVGLRALRMKPGKQTIQQGGGGGNGEPPPFAPDLSALASGGGGGKGAKGEDPAKLLEDYNRTVEKAIDLTRNLSDSLQDVNLDIVAVGANSIQALNVDRLRAVNIAYREYAKTERDIVELQKQRDSFKSKGLPTGELDAQIATARAQSSKKFSEAQVLAQAKWNQGMIDMIGKEEEYNKQIDTNNQLIANRKQGISELTEVQKVDLLIQSLARQGLDLTNGAIKDQIDLIRKRAAALDETKKALENKSFAESFKDSIKKYTDGVKDLGSALGSVAVNALQGLEDKLFEFVTTGKVKFKEFVSSILQDLARLAIKLAIVNTIKALFPKAGFAQGGIMTATGPMPLKRYSAGGIATTPQLAMFGEGSMPEAYVPLPDGRRIPVAMKGSTGSTTNVNVNVDASGSQVSGNGGQGAALGRAIAGAVQQELLRQKRPGGLLAA